MNERFREDDSLLAAQLRALGHPARLAIVRALAAQDRCLCGQIVDVLPLAQSTVSQHLKVLKEAGLIDGTVEGPRSCYRLDRDALRTVAAQVALLPEPQAAALAGLVSPSFDTICTPMGTEASPPAPAADLLRGDR